jgi:anti-sigma B factor antagonist
MYRVVACTVMWCASQVSRPHPAYRFAEVEDPRGHVVQPVGELGVEASDALRGAIQMALSDGAGPVVLDLSEVVFMDSTALSIVLAALREAWARGQALLVSGPLEPPIASLFAITGLDRFVTVHATRESAFGAVSTGA